MMESTAREGNESITRVNLFVILVNFGPTYLHRLQVV